MTTAYIVAGPESSGNRLVAAILVRSGCLGEGSTDQPKSPHEVPQASQQPVVVIAHHNTKNWITGIKQRGYSSVSVIVVIREPIATVKSQVARGHFADFATAHDRRTRTIADAITDTLESCADLHIITYEGLTEDALRSWLPSIGLAYRNGPLDLQGQESPNWISNSNGKHYGGGA